MVEADHGGIPDETQEPGALELGFDRPAAGRGDVADVLRDEDLTGVVGTGDEGKPGSGVAILDRVTEHLTEDPVRQR